MRTKGDRWTDDEIQKLIESRAMGVQFKDIAKALGRTINGCHTKFYRAVPTFDDEMTNIIRIGNLERYIQNDWASLSQDRMGKLGGYLLKQRGLKGTFKTHKGRRIMLYEGNMDVDYHIWIKRNGKVTILAIV